MEGVDDFLGDRGAGVGDEQAAHLRADRERRQQNGVAALEAELVPHFARELQIREPRLAGVSPKPVERRLGELPVGFLGGRGDHRCALLKQR